MQEENLSGSQSLALIQSMINKAKNQFGENGHLYLVWGWVILFCSLLQFVLLNYLKYPNHEMVWMLTWVAVIYQFIYLYRNRKRVKVKTYMGDILSYVWLVFVVLLILNLSLISILLKSDAYKLINPVILSLYGMPTFLSGKVLRFTPLVTGGIACWILALIAAFIPPQFHMLLIGIAVIMAWIIPGYLLRKRYQTELA